jgi:hypothetical protein
MWKVLSIVGIAMLATPSSRAEAQGQVFIWGSQAATQGGQLIQRCSQYGCGIPLIMRGYRYYETMPQWAPRPHYRKWIAPRGRRYG